MVPWEVLPPTMHTSMYVDAATSLQERARKLRIFPDEEHPFVGDPRLVPWAPQPRRLRIKEGLFEVPEGFDPLNADAYRKRYGHMLPEATVQALRQEESGEAVIPATVPE